MPCLIIQIQSWNRQNIYHSKLVQILLTVELREREKKKDRDRQIKNERETEEIEADR